MSPPYSGQSLQLMGHIFSLLMLSNPQQMEFLLYCVKPFICRERFFRALMLLMGVSGVQRNEAQCILHGSLITQELCEELIRRW